MWDELRCQLHLLTHWRPDRCLVCYVASEVNWLTYLWAALGLLLAGMVAR